MFSKLTSLDPILGLTGLKLAEPAPTSKSPFRARRPPLPPHGEFDFLIFNFLVLPGYIVSYYVKKNMVKKHFLHK